jgi:uncharacterized RDD family membrane protein YckC
METNTPSYAGFWVRWFAQLVDTSVWAVSFFGALYILSATVGTSVETFIPGLLWFLLYVLLGAGLVKFLLHPYLIAQLGAGLGKLACGLHIVRLDGAQLTYKNALFREYIAKLASNALLGAGYYWIFRNQQRQGWHDSLAGTYVLKRYNGIGTGFLVLVLFLAINAGLAYKAFDTFRANTSLQYNLVTLVTQIQQDFTKAAPSTIQTF